MNNKSSSRVVLLLGAMFTFIAIVALVSIVLIRSRAEIQTTQEASAGNAVPSIDTLQALDDVDGTDITQAGVGFNPNEGTTHSLRVTGTISDANGCLNTDNVSVAVYRSGLDQSGSWTPNANNLPQVNSVTVGPEGALYRVGNRLYHADKWNSTFKIFDISNEASPQLISSITVSAWPKDVLVSGNTAYIAGSYYGKIQSINITNENSPTILQTLDAGTDPNSLALSGNHLFVAGNRYGADALRVYDVTNPSSISQVKGITFPTNYVTNGMAVQGNYLYVTIWRTTLYTYDISDPANPVLTNQNDGVIADNVTFRNGYAYLGSNDGYLTVMNLTDPAHPTVVRTLNGNYNNSNRILVSGNYLFLGGGQLKVYSLTNPELPTLLGSSGTFTIRIYSTQLASTHAYVMDYNSIKVFDLAALVPPPTIACDDSLLDDNECYTAQTTSFTNCSGAGDTTANFLMTIPIKNFADPTDTGAHSSENWVVKAKIVDAADASSTDQVTFEMNSLAGFSIVPEALDYGTLALGELSTAQSITLTNTGNTGVNANIKADHDMTSDLPGFSDIPSTNVHYSLNSGMVYATSPGVTTSDVLFTLGLAQQTDDAAPAPSVPAYFMLQIPSSGVNGIYSNTLTLTAQTQ